MRSRILSSCPQPLTVSRAEAGEWRQLLPGVLVRCLHVNENEGTQLALWRLAAGARIPAHRHTLTEECLVVEGLITHAGIEYGAGDFLLSAVGSAHEIFESPAGALLMIRGEKMPKRISASARVTASP
ncbi:MAG: cupin domain-containing protein [Pseudomarimonas sp.]